MSNSPLPVAQYVYLNDSAARTSTADMFVGGAAREIRAVLSYVNSSAAEDLLKEFREEGLLITKANESSTDGFIVDNVTDNMTYPFDVPSEEDNSTATFGFNGTFFGNNTARNFTMAKNEDFDPFTRNGLFLAAVVFICGVILIAYLINLRRTSRNDLDDEYTPSQVVAKVRARYPGIDQEEEIEFDFGKSVLNPTYSGEKPSGDGRKNEALAPSTPPKPKKKRDYSHLAIEWDFGDKVEDQVVPVQEEDNKLKNDQEKENKLKNSETQTSLEETDILIPEEQLGQLKEEYETMVALLTDGIIED